MAKTIIQSIGPLYGEVVNGTVFGRPNGSIYVPSSNTISATLPDNWKYIRKVTYGWGNTIQACTSTGSWTASTKISVVAEAQDVQSYIGISVEDEDGVQVGTARTLSAGIFNTDQIYLSTISAEDDLTDSATYFVVCTLYSSNGVPIATSKVQVTGVVPA